MTYEEKYRLWTEDTYFDKQTREELLEIKEEKEIEERFYKDLDFGTGGLRGILGAGTNRMNIYVIRKVTQGLANFIIKEKGQDKGVAIAYDSRNMSCKFAEETAGCLCANGIKVYLFDSLRPTPELSFAVRKLNCIAGVMITASHNPAEYNGYKVYWEDGAQVTAPKDKQIIAEVNAVSEYGSAKTMGKEDAITKGLLLYIGAEIDNEYIEALKRLVLNQKAIGEMSEELKIVYTPLHGTGNILVRRILNELGFKKIFIVPEQELPDGNFSTVLYPNPEDPKAFELALALAKKVDADIVLATDPDADRLGVYAKDRITGKYMAFTGNMSGLLIAEYELSEKKKQGILPTNGALVKTIVSSDMANEMSKYYRVSLIEVLTGFKYIGEQIKFFEQTGEHKYLFGYEESYGCLLGTYARDKDAVGAVMVLCEAAAFYRKQGLSLWDQMQNIYKKYGYYKEDQVSVTLKGKDGAERIQKIIKKLRENPPKKLADCEILAIRDYQKRIRYQIKEQSQERLQLPKSNVLYYELENKLWCCIRPSGTEPKIKIYFGVKGSDKEEANQRLQKLEKAVLCIVEQEDKK